uniref:Cholesterol 25-hydroxylase like 1, tandem duplicate 1 n=1 Tax=Eptatretus burgeri TaxID=7764 RepID=A0A8C4NLY0_EPTBU
MNSSKPLLQPTWSYLLDHHSSLLHSHLFSALFSNVTLSFYHHSCLMVIGPSHWRVPRPQILGIAHRSLTERDCVVHTLLLTLFFVIPASVLQSGLRAQIELPSRAPTILEIVTGLMASLLLFDAQYFVWHCLHHACPGLYRSVHAKHHQVLQPFAWSTQFMSPYELFATGLWTAMDPIVLGLHPLTGLLFSILNVYLSVEVCFTHPLPEQLSSAI